MTPRRVRSSDGVQLAVYESGVRSAPTIVAVHGFPDNHHVWDGVVAALGSDFHVVAYDVRGAGESDNPRGRAAYRMPQLVDDLIAVLDAVSPDRPVHLLGHDWGSIQLWPALTDKRLAGRVSSFTSISGPSLDHAGAWLRQVRRHPAATLRQLAHSYYIFLFQLPWLPEVAARKGGFDRAIRTSSEPGHPRRSPDDAVNGLWLYRANMLRRVTGPKPAAIEVPVQVIVAESDAYATPELAEEAPQRWVTNLTVRRINAGHWVVCEQPALIAGLVEEFVTSSLAASRS